MIFWAVKKKREKIIIQNHDFLLLRLPFSKVIYLFFKKITLTYHYSIYRISSHFNVKNLFIHTQKLVCLSQKCFMPTNPPKI